MTDKIQMIAVLSNSKDSFWDQWIEKFKKAYTEFESNASARVDGLRKTLTVDGLRNTLTDAIRHISSPLGSVVKFIDTHIIKNIAQRINNFISNGKPKSAGGGFDIKQFILNLIPKIFVNNLKNLIEESIKASNKGDMTDVAKDAILKIINDEKVIKTTLGITKEGFNNFLKELLESIELNLNGVRNIWKLYYDNNDNNSYSHHSELIKSIINRYISLLKANYKEIKTKTSATDYMTDLQNKKNTQIISILKQILQESLIKKDSIEEINRIIRDEQISSVIDLFERCERDEYTKYWCILQYSLDQYEQTNNEEIKKDIIYMRTELMTKNRQIRDSHKSDDDSYIQALLKNGQEVSALVQNTIKSFFGTVGTKPTELKTAADVFALIQHSYTKIPPNAYSTEKVDPIALVVYYNNKADEYTKQDIAQIIRVVLSGETVPANYKKAYKQLFERILQKERYTNLVLAIQKDNKQNHIIMKSLWILVRELDLQEQYIDFFKASHKNIYDFKEDIKKMNERIKLLNSRYNEEEYTADMHDITYMQEAEDDIKFYKERQQIISNIDAMEMEKMDSEYISRHLDRFFYLSVPPKMDDIINNICYATQSNDTNRKNAYCLLDFLWNGWQKGVGETTDVMQDKGKSRKQQIYSKFIIKLRKSILASNLVERKSIYASAKNLAENRNLQSVKDLYGLLMTTGREMAGTVREVGTSIMNSSEMGRIASFIGMVTSSTESDGFQGEMKQRYDQIVVTEKQLLELIEQTKTKIPPEKDERETIISFDELSEQITNKINRTFKNKFPCTQYYSKKISRLNKVLERLYDHKRDNTTDKNNKKLWEYYVQQKNQHGIVVEQLFTDAQKQDFEKNLTSLSNQGRIVIDTLVEAVRLERELMEVLEAQSSEDINKLDNSCSSNNQKRLSRRSRSSSGRRTKRRRDEYERAFEHYHMQEEESLLAHKQRYEKKIADIEANIKVVLQELTNKDDDLLKEGAESSQENATSHSHTKKLRRLHFLKKTYVAKKKLKRQLSELRREQTRYEAKLADINEDILYQKNELQHELQFHRADKNLRVEQKKAIVRDLSKLLYLQCAWNKNKLPAQFEYGRIRDAQSVGDTRKNIQMELSGVRLSQTRLITQYSPSQTKRIDLIMLKQLASGNYLSRKSKDTRYYLNYRISEKHNSGKWLPIEIGYAGEINPSEEWWKPIGSRGPILSKNIKRNLSARWRAMFSKEHVRPTMKFIIERLASSFYKAVEFCRKVMETKANNKMHYYIDPDSKKPRDIRRTRSRSRSKTLRFTIGR